MLNQTQGFYGSNRESSMYYFGEEIESPKLEKDKQMRVKSTSDDFSAMGMAKDSVWSGQEGSTSYFSFFEQGLEDFTSEFGGELNEQQQQQHNRAMNIRTQTNLLRHTYYDEDEDFPDDRISIEKHNEQQQQQQLIGIQTNEIADSIIYSFSAQEHERLNQNILLFPHDDDNQQQQESMPTQQNLCLLPFANPLIQQKHAYFESQCEEEGQHVYITQEGISNFLNLKETHSESDSLKCNASNDELQLSGGDNEGQQQQQQHPAELILALPTTTSGFNYYQYFNQNQQKELMNSEGKSGGGFEAKKPMELCNDQNLIGEFCKSDQTALVENESQVAASSDNSNNNFIRRETKKKNKTNQQQQQSKVKRMNSELLHIGSIKQEDLDEDQSIQPRMSSLTEDSFLEQAELPNYAVAANGHFFCKAAAAAAQCKEETLKEIDEMKQCNKKNVVKNIMNAFKNFVLDTEQKNTEMIKQRIINLYNNHNNNNNNNNNNQSSESKLSLENDHAEEEQQQQQEQQQQLEEGGVFSEEVVEHNNNNNTNQGGEEEDNLSEILKKFKRYINSKNFNHYSIRLLIIHPNYGPILRYFLEGPVYEWVSSSKVNDHTSHFIMINFLMLCFSDIKFIEELKRHEKKKARFQ